MNSELAKWRIGICQKCRKPHQGTRYSSCIVEFDPAGDELAELCDVEVVPAVEVERLLEERQAVLDCINLYGDVTLHKALDAIGWPNV